MYGAKFVAERRFCTFDSAPCAVNHFGSNSNPVELCPQHGSLFAQRVIVRNRCYPRVALFAIQSATTYKWIRVFHCCLRKLKFSLVLILAYYAMLFNRYIDVKKHKTY